MLFIPKNDPYILEDSTYRIEGEKWGQLSSR